MSNLSIVPPSSNEYKNLLINFPEEVVSLIYKCIPRASEDEAQGAYAFLLEKSFKYNPEMQTKASTFIVNGARQFCFNNRKKESKNIILNFSDSNSFNENMENKIFIEDLLSKINSNDVKKMFHLYYFENKTYEEIGREFGISHESVRQQMNYAINFLSKENSYE